MKKFDQIAKKCKNLLIFFCFESMTDSLERNKNAKSSALPFIYFSYLPISKRNEETTHRNCVMVDATKNELKAAKNH